MALIDKIFGKNKTLTELSRAELRREEILISKQRDRLFKKIELINTDKQKIFKQGQEQKSPELRRALAMQFEMKTQEQLINAKELNLRTKELMTVGRLRMIQESREHTRGAGRLNLTDKDVARMSSWIEDDAVSQDMYTERLNTILDIGAQADKDAMANVTLSQPGQELMNIWNEMDRGNMKEEEGFDEADKAIRRKNASLEKEM